MPATTWDPSNTDSSITLSNGNLTATHSASGTWLNTIATGSGKTSGKWYWRVQFVLAGSSYTGAAITNTTRPTNNYIGSDNNGWLGYAQVGLSGSVQHGGAVIGQVPTYQTNGDYEVVAYDATNGGIYFTYMTAGGVLSSNWNNANANPSAATGGFSVAAGTALQPGVSLLTSTDRATLDTTTVISDPTLSGFLPYDSVPGGAPFVFDGLWDNDDMPRITNFFSLGGGTGTFPPKGGVSYISWVNGGSGSITLTMPNGSTVTTALPSGMYPISAVAVTANTMSECTGWF